MPLPEQDMVRIRQYLQKIEAGILEGMKAYVTYHDSNLASTPSNPTGDGTTGGWHREPTEASNWMSVKTALKDTAGTWGTPIRVFGLQGTETAGVGLSADIPKLEQITFIGDGEGKVGWTAGTIRYGGNSYAITVKAVGDGFADPYIYWDDADTQISFKNTDDFSVAIAAHHWVVCINDSGKAIPATSARILHGGLIQADTITANEVVAGTITYTELKQTEGSEAVDTGCIRDEATGIYETASTAAESGFFTTSLPGLELQSRAITSAGGAVQLAGGVTVHNYQPSDPVTISIYEGATQIASVDKGIPEGADVRISVFATIFPGAGSHTYKLYGKAGSANRHKGSFRDLVCSESRGK